MCQFEMIQVQFQQGSEGVQGYQYCLHFKFFPISVVIENQFFPKLKIVQNILGGAIKLWTFSAISDFFLWHSLLNLRVPILRVYKDKQKNFYLGLEHSPALPSLFFRVFFQQELFFSACSLNNSDIWHVQIYKNMKHVGSELPQKACLSNWLPGVTERQSNFILIARRNQEI